MLTVHGRCRVVTNLFVYNMPGLKRKLTYGRRKSSSSKKARVPSAMRRTTPRTNVMVSRLSTRKMYPTLPSLRTTVRYFTGIRNLNGGAGGIAAAHVFSSNGLYDPDITGTGHQAIGFDQLMLMYDHYTVVGSKIVVDFRNDDTANPYNVGIRVADSTTVITDTQEWVENGYNNYKLLNIGPSTPCVTRMSEQVDIAKYLGRKDALADSQLKGTAASNPAEQVFFHVSAFTLGGVDGAQISFQACLEFDVIFHERKAVATS